MTIRKEILDELLKEYTSPQDILGEGRLIKQLTKAVIERCLETELETHLGYGKYEAKAEGTTNSRNGKSCRTLKGEQGHLELEILVIVKAVLSHNWLRSTRRGWKASMTRSSVCSWIDHPRYPIPVARTVWRRGVADAHFQRNGCGE